MPIKTGLDEWPMKVSKYLVCHWSHFMFNGNDGFFFCFKQDEKFNIGCKDEKVKSKYRGTGFFFVKLLQGKCANSEKRKNVVLGKIVSQ